MILMLAHDGHVNEGYSGDVDLAGEAIRLTRQLAAKTVPTRA
jgi:hypothetical protein